MKIGTIELKVQKNVQYTGRKARVGAICWSEEGRMRVFVGYCPACKGKVVLSLDDARKFADKYQAERGKIKNKVLDRVISSRVI